MTTTKVATNRDGATDKPVAQPVAQSAGFDLANLDTSGKANEGVWMTVIHPGTLIPIEGMGILLAGSDSDRYQSAQRRVQQARLESAVTSRDVRRASDVKDMQRDAMDVLVSVTLDWKGVVFNGERLKFTQANVRKVYTALPWLREQVDRFVNNRSHYFRETD